MERETHRSLDVVEPKLDEIAEASDGYVLDPALYPGNATGLKTTPDGRIVLIPQPSDSKNDPLNWSPRKKATVLAIIAYITALADYTSGTGILTVLPQTREWHMTQPASQRAVVGNIFANGACGLFVVALAGYFGRLPVTLLFQAVFLGTCIWSATATSFESYLASRIINGLFCSVGQGGATMWIKDLFFFHEHPRMINYVELSVILSGHLGPLITAFIVSGTTWRWAFWVCTILAAVALLVVPLLDETLFDRSVPESSRAPRESIANRLFGVEQAKSFKHRSFLQCALRPVIAITKLPVLLVNVYYFLNYAWVLGITTTVSIWLTNYYDFTPREIGYFYFYGIVGPIIGWLMGHWLHDQVGKNYAKRHTGRIDAEARLLIAYPATVVLFICALLLGFALEHRWHYMVLAVLCTIQSIGILIVTTAINAYLLNSYPEGSGEIGAWLTASRNWSGFMSTYIQIKWVTSAGPISAFATQAGITVSSIAILVVLQLYGKRLRKWQGTMNLGALAQTSSISGARRHGGRQS